MTIPERAGATPALGSSDGHLCLAWTGTDTRLNLFWSADGWHFGAKQTLHHHSSFTQSSDQGTVENPLPPALAATSAGLYLAWTGTDLRPNVMGLRGPQAPHVVLPQCSNEGPALAARGDELALAWTGTDRHLNVARGHTNGWFGPPVTFGHKTSHAPALCFAGPDLVLAWTGTDRRLNVGVVRAGHPFQPLVLPDRSIREPAVAAAGDEVIVAWRPSGKGIHLRAFTTHLVPRRGHMVPTPESMVMTHFGPGLALHDRWLVTATVGAGHNLRITYLDF